MTGADSACLVRATAQSQRGPHASPHTQSTLCRRHTSFTRCQRRWTPLCQGGRCDSVPAGADSLWRVRSGSASQQLQPGSLLGAYHPRRYLAATDMLQGMTRGETKYLHPRSCICPLQASSARPPAAHAARVCRQAGASPAPPPPTAQQPYDARQGRPLSEQRSCWGQGCHGQGDFSRRTGRATTWHARGEMSGAVQSVTRGVNVGR